MTYISSRVTCCDLVGVSKPYHLMVEVRYLMSIFRRSIRSFSMTMSSWTLLSMPRCMYQATVPIGENSGKLVWTTCCSLVRLNLQLPPCSTWRQIRCGDVISLQNSCLHIFGMTQSRKGFEVLWFWLTKRGLNLTRRDRHEKRDFARFVVWGAVLTERFFYLRLNLNVYQKSNYLTNAFWFCQFPIGRLPCHFQCCSSNQIH